MLNLFSFRPEENKIYNEVLSVIASTVSDGGYSTGEGGVRSFLMEDIARERVGLGHF